MPSPITSRTPRDWKRAVRKFLIGLLIMPIIFFIVFLWITLNWSYSEGDRSGYLQKFSQKGWICKTYEGELAMTTVPGTAPVIWEFSVRDEAVAKEIADLIGQKVILHYHEYRNVPTTCFGATDYFVDAVTPAGKD